MRTYFQLLLLFVCGWVVAGCGEQRKKQSSCTVEMKIEYPEYTWGYLKNIDEKCLDSLTVTDGRVAFERKDTFLMPYVAFIKLNNPKDSIDWLEMPLVVEGGKINIEIGEYISIGGTPLNLQLQKFLDDLQATRSSVDEKELSMEEIKEIFSEFYRQQILGNKNNVLGRYIFKKYGIHLNDEDRKRVKVQLDN